MARFGLRKPERTTRQCLHKSKTTVRLLYGDDHDVDVDSNDYGDDDEMRKTFTNIKMEGMLIIIMIIN